MSEKRVAIDGPLARSFGSLLREGGGAPGPLRFEKERRGSGTQSRQTASPGDLSPGNPANTSGRTRPVRHRARRLSGGSLQVAGRGVSESCRPGHSFPGKLSGFPKSDIPKIAALGALKIYKILLSPLLPPACRFSPTCSEYAREAIARYGLLSGGRRALERLLRCNPFCRGGVDPVK